MSKSIADVKKEQIAKHKTGKQTYNDFPIGTKVEVISPAVDFYFFWNERGTVIRNNHEYLGIIVKFDKPRLFEDGYKQKDFNFEPQDLKILKKSTNCPHCGKSLVKPKSKSTKGKS